MELLAGMMRKSFLLSAHLGARWGLVACAGVRPRCPFCSGEAIPEDGTRVPRRSFALPPGRAGLGCVGCSSWARPVPLKDLFIQRRRGCHVCSINRNWRRGAQSVSERESEQSAFTSLLSPAGGGSARNDSSPTDGETEARRSLGFPTVTWRARGQS